MLPNGLTADILKKVPEEEVFHTKLYLSGIDCMECAKKLMIKLENHLGVVKSDLNFAIGVIDVTHICPIDEIVDFIENNGYGAEVIENDVIPREGFGIRILTRILLLISAGLLIGAGFFGSKFGVNAKLAVYFFPAAMLLGGYQIYKSALKSISNLVIDANVLIAVSTIGAAAIKAWHEAAAVIIIYNIGNLIQSNLIERSRKYIRFMTESVPREARIVTSYGHEEIINNTNVNVNDTVLIKPDEYVTADGIVLEGASRVNQVIITGEATTVEKSEGDRVFAGTINTEGSLKVKVTHHVTNSTLRKMIDIIETVLKQKGSLQQFIDGFAGYFTPAVMVLAILTIIIPVGLYDLPFRIWFYKALVLLIIASPCALVISPPVLLISAIGNAARNGILIKGISYLENLSKTRTLVFNKTGTMTTGRLEVIRLIPENNISEDELIRMASAAEANSEHPIAKAIMKEAKNRMIDIPETHSFISYQGKGVRSRLENQYIHVGSDELMNEFGISNESFTNKAAEYEKAGYIVIYVAHEYKSAGIIVLADAPRDGARDMVDSLKNYNLKDIVLLSGGHEGTVSNAADFFGIDKYKAGQLPEDKFAVISEYAQNGVTVMISDGVNNVTALSAATVGIIVGAAESDESLKNADIAMMDAELEKIPSIFRFSNVTMGIMRQNFIFSAVIKLVFLLLILNGVSNLWMAVFADLTVSILAILNSLRLDRYNF